MNLCVRSGMGDLRRVRWLYPHILGKEVKGNIAEELHFGKEA